jgi:spore germination protein PE
MRISVVDQAMINAVVFASTVFVGDMKQFAPTTYALAVQREIPVFNGNEGDLSPYLVFRNQIPMPSNANTMPVDIGNESPYIRVGAVRILSVSTSSMFQIGSTDYIRAESRIKHLRQLLHGTRPVT